MKLCVQGRLKVRSGKTQHFFENQMQNSVKRQMGPRFSSGAILRCSNRIFFACPSRWSTMDLEAVETVLLLQWFKQKGTEFWSRMMASVIMVESWEVAWSKKKRERDFKSSSNTVELLMPLREADEKKWGGGMFVEKDEGLNYNESIHRSLFLEIFEEV